MTDLAPPRAPIKHLLDWALSYSGRGVAVFATTADGKAPAISNKSWEEYLGYPVPKGRGGLHQASTDPDNLRWQFGHRNAGGIGMPCGRINGVIVADFDIHKENGTGNAHRQWEEWSDQIGDAHQVTTRNGGKHVYFAYEEGHGKHELGENIEVQTDGAYVLLPPSKGYKVTWPVSREDWATPPWPAVPTKRIAREDVETMTSDQLLAMQAKIKAGEEWHNNMIATVAHMVMTGWSDAEILRLSRQWTLPGYSHDDTFEEVYTAIQGARVKWMLGRGLSDKERRVRWMDDFLSFTPSQRQQAKQWMEKHFDD